MSIRDHVSINAVREAAVRAPLKRSTMEKSKLPGIMCQQCNTSYPTERKFEDHACDQAMPNGTVKRANPSMKPRLAKSDYHGHPTMSPFQARDHFKDPVDANMHMVSQHGMPNETRHMFGIDHANRTHANLHNGFLPTGAKETTDHGFPKQGAATPNGMWPKAGVMGKVRSLMGKGGADEDSGSEGEMDKAAVFDPQTPKVMKRPQVTPRLPINKQAANAIRARMKTYVAKGAGDEETDDGDSGDSD